VLSIEVAIEWKTEDLRLMTYVTYVTWKINWSTVRYQFFDNVKKAALRCKE